MDGVNEREARTRSGWISDSVRSGVADDIGSTAARIQFAIANRQLVEVRYSGSTRVAEPHDYGIQNGRERLLVFQLRGMARPGHTAIGWRLLEVSKIQALTVLDDSFKGSRGQSHSAHYKWEVIYARVK
jgi:hypothetical protein